MIDSLTVRNFRGIPSLKIDDLGRINIFVGSNGAGKTTLLEALYIGANPTSPGLLSTLGQWREMPPLHLFNDDALRSIFINLSTSFSPEVVIESDHKTTTLRIEAILGNSENALGLAGSTSGSGSSSAEENLAIHGIKYHYQPSDGRAVDARIALNAQGFQSIPAPPVQHLGAFMIHARRATSVAETARVLTALYERNGEAEFIDAVNRIDKRIRRLVVGTRQTGPVVLADVGRERMLSTNSLGDGFCRIMLMVTGLLYDSSRLVLVDEVDSGLHHSVMASFWESAHYLLANRQDKQLFCTTHSEEMLYATLSGLKDAQNSLRVFRVDRGPDDQMEVKKFDYKRLELADKSGVDIR